jgi:hypothetical protein
MPRRVSHTLCLAKVGAQCNSLATLTELLPGLFQNQWDCVLELATDTCPVEAGGKPVKDPSDNRNASVRRQAMLVIDAVYRNGLAAPWLAIPTLVALTTDPCR